MTEITIKTERFGDIQVAEDRVIRFVEPILGFDNSRSYVILDHSENSPFKWLQSVEEPELAFVVTNPRFFSIDYEFALSDDAAAQLEIAQEDDALVLTIVNIPQDDPGKMTANLLGPVVINQNTRKAMQVVLNDPQYSTKTRLIPDELLKQQAAGSSAQAKEE